MREDSCSLHSMPDCGMATATRSGKTFRNAREHENTDAPLDGRYHEPSFCVHQWVAHHTPALAAGVEVSEHMSHGFVPAVKPSQFRKFLFAMHDMSHDSGIKTMHCTVQGKYYCTRQTIISIFFFEKCFLFTRETIRRFIIEFSFFFFLLPPFSIF